MRSLSNFSIVIFRYRSTETIPDAHESPSFRRFLHACPGCKHMGHRWRQFRYPLGLAVSSDGSVYVSDWRNSRIQKLTLEGVFVNQWGKWLRKEGTDYGGCLASRHIQLVLNHI